jgi:hypothetical protein
VKSLDIVLVATMTILYKLHQQLRESPYGGDGSRVQRMEELRGRARGVMMFAGMVRLSFLAVFAFSPYRCQEGVLISMDLQHTAPVPPHL